MRRPLGAWTGVALLLTLPCLAACGPKASVSGVRQIAGDAGQTSAGAASGGWGQGAVEPAAIAAATQAHVVNDAELGMPAFNIVTPAGWSAQGHTSHGGACTSPQDDVNWQAFSPDGAYGVQFLGGYKYGQISGAMAAQVVEQMRAHGCVLSGEVHAAEALRNLYLPHAFPDARIVSIKPIPDSNPTLATYQQMMRAAQAKTPDTAQMQSRRSLDGAVARISFVRNGRTEEADIQAIASCQDTRMSRPPMETLDCTLGPIVMMQAPQGKLEAFQARTDIVQFNNNPAYVQRVAAIRAQESDQAVQRINASGEQARAQQNAQTQQILAMGRANVAGIQARGAAIVAAGQAQSRAYDESNQAFIRRLGGEAQYSTPSGATFNASNQYNHTYVDGAGHVVQTDSAYPPGAGWTEAQGH